MAASRCQLKNYHMWHSFETHWRIVWTRRARLRLAPHLREGWKLSRTFGEQRSLEYSEVAMVELEQVR
jgi:hypothetical protein